MRPRHRHVSKDERFLVRGARELGACGGPDHAMHTVRTDNIACRNRTRPGIRNHRDVDGGRVEFGVREDALLLRREMLLYPLPEEAPELAGQFEAYAAALVRRMTPQTSVAEQVRQAIAEGLLSGAVSETAVAARLALTVRTMHRHLVEAGTSFRGIRDELLRQRAKELLSERRVPIAEVSFLLGYSDPSSFHRAFRRWTGFTPAEWRKTNAPQSQVSP